MFYGPIMLDGSTPQQGQEIIRQRYPGASGFTMYPGAQGVGTAALGFSHGGPPLFAGQPPSSLSALVSSRPNLFEGISVQPESVTGTLSGATTPGGGVVDHPWGIGDPGVVGGTGSTGVTSAPGVSTSASGGHDTSQMGNPLGLAGTIANITSGLGQVNAASPIGQLSSNLGVNPTVGTTIAGLLGNAIAPGVGTAIGLANSALGAFGPAPTATSPQGAQTVSGLMGVVQGLEGWLEGTTPPATTSAPQTDPTAIAVGALGTGPGSESGIPSPTQGELSDPGLSPAPTSAVTGQPGQPGLFSTGDESGSTAPGVPGTGPGSPAAGIGTGGGPGGSDDGGGGDGGK